jgi:hypothetical protein
VLELDEGRLRFAFPADCEVVKFDDSDWYRRTQRDGIKGMDFLVTQGHQHWWVEVKDCQGFENENKPRLSPAEPVALEPSRKWLQTMAYDDSVQVKRKKPFILDEVAEKLHGTLLTLMAARRAPADNSARVLHPFMAVVDGSPAWTVVLLLTWEDRDFKRLAVRLQDQFAKKLKTFRVQTYIINTLIPLPHQPWIVTRRI